MKQSTIFQQNPIQQQNYKFETPMSKYQKIDFSKNVTNKFVSRTDNKQSMMQGAITLKKQLFQKSGVKTPPITQQFIQRESQIPKPSIIEKLIQEKKELQFQILQDEPFQQLKILNDLFSDDEIKIMSFKEFGLEEKVIKCICHQHDKESDTYNCILQCQLLKNEFEIAKLFENNPRIIQQYEYKECEDKQGLADQIGIPCCYIIMEKAPYGDLYTQSLKNTDDNGMKGITFELHYFKSIFTQICYAIQALHEQSVSHNDIKLDNIYVFDFDEEQKKIYVKLADLGYANTGLRQMSRQEQFDLFEFKNPEYSSPEIRSLFDKNCKSKKPINEFSSDIYNLGQTMLEAITGLELKFTSKNFDLQEIVDNYQFQILQDIICDKYKNPRLQVKNQLLLQYWQPYMDSIFELIFDCLQSDQSLRPTLISIIQQLNKF